VLIWGSSWYAITFQLGAVNEAVSLFYRFLLAAVLLIVWCLLRRIPLRFSLAEHGFIAAQGLCLFSTNYLLFYWCTAYIASGLVAVIFSTVIVMNIFNGALFLKRRVRPQVLLAACVGLLGIVLVFWNEVLAANAASAAASSRVWKGLALGLVATLSASLGNILSARNQAAGLPVLQTNAIGMSYGSLVMLAFALISGASFHVEWTLSYAVSLVYLSVFGSIVAFGAYLSLVGRLGADRAAYATVVFPIVALLISSVFEDFVWTPMALSGVALVILGNILVVGRRNLGAVVSRLQRV
jgi:drug/metabolite transporter (DMT)-like permease